LIAGIHGVIESRKNNTSLSISKEITSPSQEANSVSDHQETTSSPTPLLQERGEKV